MRRLRRATGWAGVVVLAWLTVGATPATAADQPPTVSGDSLTGTYSSPNGEPILYGGYRLPTSLAPHVSSLTCSGGGVAMLGSGPAGSPECKVPGLTSVTVTITFDQPLAQACGCSTFTVNGFWNYTGSASDYVFGPDITVRVPTASPAPAPTSSSAAPATS